MYCEAAAIVCIVFLPKRILRGTAGRLAGIAGPTDFGHRSFTDLCVVLSIRRLLIFQYRTPGSIRVKELYAFGGLQSFGSQILFIDHSVLANHKGLNP